MKAFRDDRLQRRSYVFMGPIFCEEHRGLKGRRREVGLFEPLNRGLDESCRLLSGVRGGARPPRGFSCTPDSLVMTLEIVFVGLDTSLPEQWWSYPLQWQSVCHGMGNVTYVSTSAPISGVQ